MYHILMYHILLIVKIIEAIGETKNQRFFQFGGDRLTDLYCNCLQ